MAKILLVGCGDLGTEIAVRLHASGHEVVGVRKSTRTLPLGMRTIQADVTERGTLAPLAVEVIVYCVAASAQTDENYHRHYVQGLRNVLQSQSGPQLKHVFFVSSTRVYGQHADALLDEATPAIATDFGGERLLEAEQLLSALPCSSTVLRLSGIYGPGRLYLVNLAKDQTRWPAENQWTNRIHRDDAAAFAAFLVGQVLGNQSIHPLYIVTDDLPVAQYEVLTWLATNMGGNVKNVRIPPVTQGKRLSNERLRDTGFVLSYPSYQHGYSTLI
jgi:nucleoside-diphosphate-sugar epimerase